jgi:hypothetical protein
MLLLPACTVLQHAVLGCNAVVYVALLQQQPTCHGPTAVHVRVCRIALVVHVHVRGKAAASTVASRARTPLWKGPSEGGNGMR